MFEVIVNGVAHPTQFESIELAEKAAAKRRAADVRNNVVIQAAGTWVRAAQAVAHEEHVQPSTSKPTRRDPPERMATPADMLHGERETTRTGMPAPDALREDAQADTPRERAHSDRDVGKSGRSKPHK